MTFLVSSENTEQLLLVSFTEKRKEFVFVLNVNTHACFLVHMLIFHVFPVIQCGLHSSIISSMVSTNGE